MRSGALVVDNLTTNDGVMINQGKPKTYRYTNYEVTHLIWAAKYRSKSACGILTAVIVGRQSRLTALA